MTERRTVWTGKGGRIATAEQREGVAIKRNLGSEIVIPWEALREVTLDLMRRLGERPATIERDCQRCGGPCLRTPPHEEDR